MLEELRRWLSPRFRTWRGKLLQMFPPQKVIAGDCSKTQLGAVGLLPNAECLQAEERSHVTNFEWAQPLRDPDCPPISLFLPEFMNGVKVRNGHSTICELAGACLAIETYRVLNGWRGLHVKYLGDNVCAKKNLKDGGGRMYLQNLIQLHFAEKWREAELTVSMGFRSGQTMIDWGVDGLSREKASMADITIQPKMFHALMQMLRPYGLLELESLADLFAESSNAQCSTFGSLYPEADASWCNSLLVDWGILPATRLYAFPPPVVIAKCIQQARRLRHDQILLLVVPAWPSQPWWPHLMETLITLPVFFSASSQTLAHPLGLAEALGSVPRYRARGWPMMAVVSSSQPTRCEEFRLRLRQRLASDGRPALLARMQAPAGLSSNTQQAEDCASSALQTLS